MEFQYVIDASADEPIMLILNHIGYDPEMGYGVDGNEFLRELLMLDTMGKKRIQVWINSIGGSVIDGWSILGGMLKSKTKVDTYNIGVAASTAGWLFQAGRKRYMSDYALCMEHNPSGGDERVLNLMRDSICTIISERTGKTKDEVYKRMDEETYMGADEALENKYCDEIVSTSSMNVRRISQVESVIDKWKEAAAIVNTFLPTKQTITKTTDMEGTNKISAAITNKLKLHEAASDVMVVEAIEAVHNKLTVAETNLTVAENKITSLQEKLTAAENKCKDLEKEVKNYEEMMEEAEDELRMTEAKNMVQGYADAGKIKNDEATISSYVGFATTGTTKDEKKANFDRIKNMLDSLPVNKEAKKIEVINTPAVEGSKGALALALNRIAREKGQIK